MRKGLMFGLLALVVFGAGTAFAGLPCAAYSSNVIAFTRQTGTGFPCAECDLVWCPSGDYEKMYVRVTVRDCLNAPVATCDVRLDISGTVDVNNDNPAGNNGRICGTASRTLTTNANGAVEFPIFGGGAGRFELKFITTALCADPDIELATIYDTLCIKSFDFNGTGGVNFSDTFQYTPKLSATTGYSADFRSCTNANTVNFSDTFVYTPHLSGAHTCAGGSGSSFLLTKITTGIDCDQLF